MWATPSAEYLGDNGGVGGATGVAGGGRWGREAAIFAITVGVEGVGCVFAGGEGEGREDVVVFSSRRRTGVVRISGVGAFRDDFSWNDGPNKPKFNRKSYVHLLDEPTRYI